MDKLTIKFSPQVDKKILFDFTLNLILHSYEHELRSNLNRKWFRFKLNIHQEEILGHLIALKYIVYEIKVCDAHLHMVVDECISPCIGSSCCSGNKHTILFISMVDNLELTTHADEEIDTSNFIL